MNFTVTLQEENTLSIHIDIKEGQPITEWLWKISDYLKQCSNIRIKSNNLYVDIDLEYVFKDGKHGTVREKIMNYYDNNKLFKEKLPKILEYSKLYGSSIPFSKSDFGKSWLSINFREDWPTHFGENYIKYGDLLIDGLDNYALGWHFDSESEHKIDINNINECNNIKEIVDCEYHYSGADCSMGIRIIESLTGYCDFRCIDRDNEEEEYKNAFYYSGSLLENEWNINQNWRLNLFKIICAVEYVRRIHNQTNNNTLFYNRIHDDPLFHPFIFNIISNYISEKP